LHIANRSAAQNDPQENNTRAAIERARLALSGSLRVAGDPLTCYGIERLIRNRWIFQQRRISGHHASGPKGLCGTAIQSLSITAEERCRTTSLAALAFHAKDALFVIDDFAPQGQQ
jgi:hypothetical protein